LTRGEFREQPENARPADLDTASAQRTYRATLAARRSEDPGETALARERHCARPALALFLTSTTGRPEALVGDTLEERQARTQRRKSIREAPWGRLRATSRARK
jgi:hypothetical protein